MEAGAGAETEPLLPPRSWLRRAEEGERGARGGPEGLGGGIGAVEPPGRAPPPGAPPVRTPRGALSRAVTQLRSPAPRAGGMGQAPVRAASAENDL